MVRDSAALMERYLVGTDIKSPIDGGGIAADDFAAAPERELDAERALACGSRAQNGEDRLAQALHPEKREDHSRAEQDQQSKLLGTGRTRHPLTGNRQDPRCRGTSR
jgi:hypothetical protein